jgi:hypothetical protein
MMERIARSLALTVIGILVGCQTSMRELEPTPPARTDMTRIERTIPPHEPFPGTRARTALLFAQSIPGLGLRLEVREYYVSQGDEAAISPASDMLCEIRGGRFDVAAPEVKGERVTGTMWTAAPGDRVAVKTTSEMAVLRCTSVVRE